MFGQKPSEPSKHTLEEVYPRSKVHTFRASSVQAGIWYSAEKD
jgi:hypothetical protein